jgi:hypothetical protein
VELAKLATIEELIKAGEQAGLTLDQMIDLLRKRVGVGSATPENSRLSKEIAERIRRETGHKKLVKLVNELIRAIAAEEKKLSAKK